MRLYVAAVLVLGAHLAYGEALEITVHADSEQGTIYNFWSTGVMTVQEAFDSPGNCGEVHAEYPVADYINCVRLLGGKDGKKDDYFRGVDADGEAKCDFSGLLLRLRGLIDCGFKPRLVLDNVPAAMSGSDELHMYGNTLPPRDENVWHSYIRQLAETLVREFGPETVRQWRFRVGTEPDLYRLHWLGTKEDYLKHYDYTVDAITSVIPNADIGPGNGRDPARHDGKKGQWSLDIIDHCATGTNYKTGRVGTPMGFFACSYYGDVGTPMDRFERSIGLIRERLGKYPEFAEVPVEVHEFGILRDEQGLWTVGDATEWGASWMAAIADKIYDLRVNDVYQWAWGSTIQGVPVPRLHVLSLLDEMEGLRRLRVETPAAEAGEELGTIAGKAEESMDILVYRHRGAREDGPPIDVSVNITPSGDAGEWQVTRARIMDREHDGFIRAFYTDAEAAGVAVQPNAPLYGSMLKLRYGEAGEELFAKSRDKYLEMSALEEMKPLPQATATDDGGFRIPLRLNGHTVIHLHLELAH